MPTETTEVIKERRRREDRVLVGFVFVCLYAAALACIVWQTHQTVQHIVGAAQHDQ